MVMPTTAEIERRLYLKDISLSATDRRGEANGGDMPTQEGRENAHVSLVDAVSTLPGSLLHRPNYGAGVQRFLGKINSPAERARLAAAVRRALLADPRVERAAAGVNPGTKSEEAVVDIQARLIGDQEFSDNQIPLGALNAY